MIVRNLKCENIGRKTMNKRPLMDKISDKLGITKKIAETTITAITETITDARSKAHNSLGNTYSDKGMCDEAIAEYKKAIEINPKLGEAHNNLAVMYYFKGEYSSALKHCDTAIDLGCKVHPKFLKMLRPYRGK